MPACNLNDLKKKPCMACMCMYPRYCEKLEDALCFECLKGTVHFCHVQGKLAKEEAHVVAKKIKERKAAAAKKMEQEALAAKQKAEEKALAAKKAAKIALEETAAKKAAEEVAAKAAAAKKMAEEAAAKRAVEEVAAKDAAAKKKAEEEAASAKKRGEEEAAAVAKKKPEEEAAAAKRKAEEEVAVKKKPEEEVAAAAAKKAAEEAAAAAAKKKGQEEAAAIAAKKAAEEAKKAAKICCEEKKPEEEAAIAAKMAEEEKVAEALEEKEAAAQRAEKEDAAKKAAAVRKAIKEKPPEHDIGKTQNERVQVSEVLEGSFETHQETIKELVYGYTKNDHDNEDEIDEEDSQDDVMNSEVPSEVDEDSSNEDDVDSKPALEVKDLPLAVQKRVKTLKNVLEHDMKLLPHRDKLDAGMLIEVAASFPLLQARRGESVAPSLNLIQSPTKAVEGLDKSVRENELEEEDVNDEAFVANQNQADDKEQKVARKPALIIAELEDGSMRVEVMANLDGNGITSKDMLSWIKMDIEFVQVLVVIAARVNMNVSAISCNQFVEYGVTHKVSTRETLREVAMAKQSEFNVESYSLEKRKEKHSNNQVALVYTGQFAPGIRDSLRLNENNGALPTEYRQISIGNKEYGEFVMDSRLGEPAMPVKLKEGIGVYKDNASTHKPSKFFINSDKFFKGSMLAANNEKSPNFDKQLEHPTRIMCNQGTYKDKLLNYHCQFDPGISCNQQGGLELLRTEPQFSVEQRRASVQLSGGSERGVHGRGVQVERLETLPQFSGGSGVGLVSNSAQKIQVEIISVKSTI